MRELLILRHAKSDWSTGEPDFDRPLNDRGKRDAQKMGKWLRKEGLIPDTIISSTACRARKTALKVAREMKFPDTDIQWQIAIYEAPVERLMTLLRGCATAANRVLLIGHNPGLEGLLLHLCPDVEIPADGKLLATCTVARLRVEADWPTLSAGNGSLLNLVRPRSLPD